jgi:hypothetical protein
MVTFETGNEILLCPFAKLLDEISFCHDFMTLVHEIVSPTKFGMCFSFITVGTDFGVDHPSIDHPVWNFRYGIGTKPCPEDCGCPPSGRSDFG